MTDDTGFYLYLMSALMQVFGALIAVDAIFLVFRHEALRRRLSDSLHAIGFAVAQYHTKTLIGFSYASNYHMKLTYYSDQFIHASMRKQRDDLEETESWSQAKFAERQAKDEGGTMSGDTIVAQELMQAIRGARYTIEKLDTALSNTQNCIWKLMGTPAVMVVLFGLGLIIHPCVKNPCIVAFIALAVAFLALWYLVSQAHKLMNDKEII